MNRTYTFVWYSRVKLAENFGREFQTFVSPSRSDENVKKHVGSSVTKEGMLLTTYVTC